MNCLVFRHLRDPVQRIGSSLNQCEDTSYLISVRRAMCLILMMFLIEIAALIGAVVILVVYTMPVCVVIAVLVQM